MSWSSSSPVAAASYDVPGPSRLAAAAAVRPAVRLDPPADIMLQLEATTNINSMQIVLVDGLLDAALVRRAAIDVAPRFPLLLSKVDPRSRRIVPDARTPGEILCEEVLYEHPLTFDDFGFRQAIVALSMRHPLRWRDGIPLRLWVLRSTASRRSCLLVNTSHATADAKSDSLLLEALMRRYGALLGGRSDASQDDDETHGFDSLQQLFPGMLRSPAATARGALGAMREMLTHDVGLVPSPRDGRVLDFHHEVMPEQLDRAVRLLSRKCGETITTLVSAALARVVAARAAVATRPGNKRVRLVSAVSVRRHAGPAARRHYRNFMVPCRIRVGPARTTAEQLADVGRQYRALKNGGALGELSKMAMVARVLRHEPSGRVARWLIGRIQGTSACYSNPGVIEEDFRHFGVPHLPIVSYLGVGCVVAPLAFVVYTPQVNGRLHLNGVYWRDLLGGFESAVSAPLKAELTQLCREFQIETERHA